MIATVDVSKISLQRFTYPVHLQHVKVIDRYNTLTST